MKNLILALLLALSPLTFTGCKNSPERTAASIAKAEITSVDAAMRAFVAYEKQFGMSAAIRQRVDGMYQNHVRLNLAVETAWLNFKAEPEATKSAAQAKLNTAINASTSSGPELVDFVIKIIGLKPRPSGRLWFWFVFRC